MLLVNKTSNNLAEDQVGGDLKQNHSSGECLLPGKTQSGLKKNSLLVHSCFLSGSCNNFVKQMFVSLEDIFSFLNAFS